MPGAIAAAAASSSSSGSVVGAQSSQSVNTVHGGGHQLLTPGYQPAGYSVSDTSVGSSHQPIRLNIISSKVQTPAAASTAQTKVSEVIAMIALT